MQVGSIANLVLNADTGLLAYVKRTECFTTIACFNGKIIIYSI